MGHVGDHAANPGNVVGNVDGDHENQHDLTEDGHCAGDNVGGQAAPTAENRLDQTESLAEHLLPAGQLRQEAGNRNGQRADHQCLGQLRHQYLELGDRVVKPAGQATGEIDHLLKGGNADQEEGRHNKQGQGQVDEQNDADAVEGCAAVDQRDQRMEKIGQQSSQDHLLQQAAKYPCQQAE